MSQFRFVIGSFLIAATMVLTAGAVRNQEPDQEPDNLESRVERLESRVKKLESILFATSKLSEMEAEEEFNRAKAILKESEKLHMRGFINFAAVQADRFRLEQARRELDLALTEDRQQQIVGEIDLLQSERELEMAQENLEHSQKLFDRGYVSEREMQRVRREVLQFQRRLELAQNKAKAAADLQNQTVDELEKAADSEDDK